MPIRKQISSEDVTIRESKLHKLQQLTSASQGIKFHTFYSGSESNNQSSSYWDFCHFHFYLSGSSQLSSSLETRGELQKFTNPWFGLVPPTNNIINPQWRTKFHSTGSVLSIPQFYYGEQIKPGSFKLTDNSHPSGSIIVIDDNYGNLYSTNATVSQSGLPGQSAMSSSRNYVGNIFYDYGVVTITETGSHTGPELVTNNTFDVSGIPSCTGSNVGSLVNTPDGWNNSGLDTSDDISEINSSSAYVLSGDGSWYVSASAHSEGIKTDEFSLTSAKKYHISADIYLKAFLGTNPHSVVLRDANNRVDVSMNVNTSSIAKWQQVSGSFVASSTGTEQIVITSLSESAEFYIDNVSVREEAPDYTDVGSGQYSLQFQATNTIFTHEYNVRIEPNEFNSTMNLSARAVFTDRTSGSADGSGTSHIQTPLMWNDLTGSRWAPHATTIVFYDENHQEPVMIARYPQPIKMRKDVGLNFLVKLDI